MADLTPVLWAIALLAIAISTPASIKLDERLHATTPDAKPYKWGYFIGLSGAIGNGGLTLLAFISAGQTYGRVSNNFVLLSLYCLAATIAHVFLVRRKKWGAALAIALQLNPLLWVVNGIYLANRWNELEKVRFDGLTRSLRSAPYIYRALIAATAFWLFLVIAFVIAFEPYGSYMSQEDLWQVIKIILFFPAVAAVGLILYTKLIKSGA